MWEFNNLLNCFVFCLMKDFKVHLNKTEQIYSLFYADT